MSQQGYIGRNPGDGRTIVNRQTSHVTTGVQTSFTMTVGYEVGYLDVYLNGIKQTETLDYTASDGSTINFALSYPPVNGDVLEFVAFETLNITNIKSARRNFSVGQDLDVTGNVTIGSSLTVASDLVVNGTFTTINTEILDVEDKTVGIASTSSPSNTTADGAGIVIYGGSDGDKSITWNTDKSNFVIVGGGVSIGTGVTISTPAANVLAFSVNSAEKARFNNFGAFTVGYEGEAWHESTYVGVLQAGSGAWIGQTPGASARAEWVNNAYYDAVNTRWEYIAADEANRIVLENGELKVQSADAGSADGAITWNEKLKMTVGGDFKIGAPTGIGVTISSSGNIDAIGIITATTFNGSFTGTVTGAASQITVADESSDTTCFPTFVTAATGDLPPKTGTNLTFNSSSGALTATSFVGGNIQIAVSNGNEINTSTGALTLDSAFGQVNVDDRFMVLGISTFSGHVLPGTDSSYNLGSNSVRFANAYVDTYYGSGANLTALNASNLGSGTVPTARLGSGTASSSTFLRGDSTFQTVNTDLVSDTSPQLGGDLDTNSHHILIDDDHEVKFGASSDLRIFHSGGNANFIQSYNNNYLRIQTFGTSAQIRIQTNESQNNVVCSANGATELGYSGNIKLATTNVGVDVTGGVTCDGVTVGDNEVISLGNSTDLKLYHDSGNNYVGSPNNQSLVFFTNNSSRWLINGSGHMLPLANNTYDIGSVNEKVKNIHSGQIIIKEEQEPQLIIQDADSGHTGAGAETGISFRDGGGTQQSIIGHHNSGSGSLFIGTNINEDVVFVHNDTNTIGIGAGIMFPFTNNNTDLGNSSLRFRNIYTNDLQLSNEGSTNSVDNTWGDYTIQEGESDLFLINNRSGKKFKFMLQEVS